MSTLILVGSAVALTRWGSGLVDAAEDLGDAVQGVLVWRQGRVWTGYLAVISAIAAAVVRATPPTPRGAGRWMVGAALLVVALGATGFSALGGFLVGVAAVLGGIVFFLRSHPEAAPLGVGGIALVTMTRMVPLGPGEAMPDMPIATTAAVLVAAGAAAMVLRPRALWSVVLLWGGAVALSWEGPDPWPAFDDGLDGIELAADHETAFAVNDVGQYHVVSIDPLGVATGIPDKISGADQVRLDIDRRALGRHVLEVREALRPLGIDGVQIRVIDPVPHDPAIPSQRSRIHIVSANLEHRIPDVPLRIGLVPTLQLNGQPMDHDRLPYELTRRLRPSRHKVVAVDLTPDRAWEDLLALVTLARTSGAVTVVLSDPEERSPPPPPPPPPPPTANGEGNPPAPPQTFHHSELEVKRRVSLAYPAEAGAQHLGEQRCKATVTMDPQGVPQDVVVTDCPEVFHAEVRDRLLEWRWYPPRHGGEKVAAVTTIGVTFRLD